MLSFAESKYLLDLMSKSFEDHIHTIEMINEKIEFHRTLNKDEVIAGASTEDLIDELCKRSGVVEYKHGENTYFEIVKYDKPGVSGIDRVINGYKIIDAKDRIFVVSE